MNFFLSGVLLGSAVVVLGHPDVSILFFLRLLGFVEHGGLAAVRLLPLLCVAASYFLSPYHLNFGAMDFGDGVLLWVLGLSGPFFTSVLLVPSFPPGSFAACRISCYLFTSS